MGALFNLGNENGDLREYDDKQTAGVLDAVAGAALAGTGYGLTVTIPAVETVWVQKDVTAPASGHIRYRFYFDPNTVTMVNGESFGIHRLGVTLAFPDTINLIHCVYAGGDYNLSMQPRTDAGNEAADTQIITDVEHYVEVHIEQASTATAADGRVRWWIDGVLKQTWADLDNYDIFAAIAAFRIGLTKRDLIGTASGTFYHDETLVRDDVHEIGPLVAAVGGALAAIRDRVELLLQDDANATWAAGDIDEAIQEALERYTGVNPAREIDTVTLTADGREIDISGITDYLSIERVWWDYDNSDPRHPPRWRDFELWSGSVLYINDSDEPQNGDVVRVWFTKLQTIDGLSGAGVTTLPAGDETLIVTGAAGIAAIMRSREVSELLGVDGWVARRAREWGEERLVEFEAGLKLIAAQLASRASGIAGVPCLDRWEADGSGWW